MAPFHHDDSEQGNRVTRTRLVESVIIAALTGVVSSMGSYFWTVPVLTERVEYLRADVAHLRNDVARIERATAQSAVDVARLQEQMVNFQRASEQRLQRLEEQVFGIPRGRK